MRAATFVLLLVLTLPAVAQGTLLKVDVTYTNGQILSGPLTPDLDALPESVLASFTLTSPAGTLADIVESSLVFGDGAWSASDLESFSATFLPTDAGGFAVTSLTYAYRPIDTPTADGRLAANFPLEIQGTDVATGEAFDYLYDTSSSTVTVVPEPTTAVLAVIGLTALLAWARVRHERRFDQCAQ